MLSSARFIKPSLKYLFLSLIYIIPAISQFFSNEQKSRYLSPKSCHLLFNSPSPATAQKPLPRIRHICGLGASVGCERVERTFNTLRLKSQICLIRGNGFVCSSLNELNSKLVDVFFCKVYNGVINFTGGMQSEENDEKNF